MEKRRGIEDGSKCWGSQNGKVERRTREEGWMIGGRGTGEGRGCRAGRATGARRRMNEKSRVRMKYRARGREILAFRHTHTHTHTQRQRPYCVLMQFNGPILQALEERDQFITMLYTPPFRVEARN